MHRILLFAPALPLLLAGCASLHQPRTLAPPPPPAVRLADAATSWGVLPRYDAKGQYFYHVSRPFSHDYVLTGVTTLDLLVNRDGRVQNIEVVASSGDVATDRMAKSMYWHARYSLPLDPDAPAPYVVREIVFFKGSTTRETSNWPHDYSSPENYPASSPPGQNPAYSNSSVVIAR